MAGAVPRAEIELTSKQMRELKVRAARGCVTCGAAKNEPCEGKANGTGVVGPMTWSHRTRYDGYRITEKAQKRNRENVWDRSLPGY